MAFYRAHILVDTGTAAVLKGAMAVKSALVDEINKRNLDKEIKVVETGDLGIQGGGTGNHCLSRRHCLRAYHRARHP